MQKWLTIAEIAPEKKEKLLVWFEQLETTRREEALDSLVQENVRREFGTVAQIEGKWYEIGFVESDGEIAHASVDLPINIEHKSVRKEALLPGKYQKVQLAYDLRA